MGIVLRGFDPALNRHCAIKVLAPELAYHAAARKRFSREAKSAAAVVHPNVIPILTVDECDGIPYLVMPVVKGESLQQRVFRTGPLSILETVRIATQIADGFAAAHAQGLIHRDIKPGNILLGQGIERVQLTDFGLARAADDASRTRSGIIAGTPQYMSPEQARGIEIDQRSDLFSLGCVLYFMLSGRSPFRAESTMGVLHRIVNDEPRSLRTINSDVPLWLEEIAMKLLRKNPTERFLSANELAELLHQWLAHLQNPSESPPPKSYRPASSQRRKLIAAVMVSISLALLLTAWFVYDRLSSINLNSPNLGQHSSASVINESLDDVHLEVDQLLNELE
jgi:serine/threonine protein kinase